METREEKGKEGFCSEKSRVYFAVRITWEQEVG